LSCRRKCSIKKSSAKSSYFEGGKYCSICRIFIATEDTYCFCCEYRLSDEKEMERKMSEVSYFNFRKRN
jgi:hypothetical protein